MRQPVVPTLAAFVPNMSLGSSACSCRAPLPQSVSLRTLEVSNALFFFSFIIQLTCKELISNNRDLGNYPSTLCQSSSFAQREPMGRSSRIDRRRLDHVNHSRYPTHDCPQNV